MPYPPSPTWDPLGYNTPLPLKREYFPLGFPLLMESNSTEVLAAAETSWPETAGRFSAPRLHMRVVTAPGQDSHWPPAPRYRAQGKFLSLAADASHFAACDFEAGTAACWVSEALAANHTQFRYHYLEGIVYSLLGYQRLTPIHASCVALSGKGALLSGPPGTGKSCLAYACSRAGLTFVSDDVGYLVRGDAGNRIVGRPRFLRLRPSAIELFGDLRGTPVGADVEGEPILEIPLTTIEGIQTAPECFAAATVFLERQADTRANLTRIQPSTAVERLVRELPVIDPTANREQVASIEKLVERGAWKLHYGDLPGAVQAIKQLLSG
jgi:hypothetical protein